MIICYGFQGSNSKITTYYPVAFTTTCCINCFSVYSSGNTHEYHSIIMDKTLTTCKLYLGQSGTAYNQNISGYTHNYICIGY